MRTERTTRTGQAGPRPRSGRPALISRDDILRVAAELGLDDLTVQAVASRLGVTRAAVYRYVGSTAELRRLTARSMVSTPTFSGEGITDWRQWLTGFAHGFRAWRLANARSDQYLYLSRDVVLQESILEIIEDGVERLIAAGFTEDRAARALQFMAGMVWVNSSDEILSRQSIDGVHPQERELLGAAEQLPHVHHLLADVRTLSSADERFETELAWVIAGLESELTPRDSTND